MENRYIKPNLVLAICGALGLFAFILLLPRFFPSRAISPDIDKSDAIRIASHYLKQKGHSLLDFHVAAIVDYDSNTFIYQQQQHGWQKSQDLFQNGYHKGMGVFWRIVWYKNLPRSTQYEKFSAKVSNDGNVIAFRHTFPVNLDWPGKAPHLEQPEALKIAQTFLKNRGINLAGYIKGTFSTRKYNKRTDHSFTWVKNLDAEAGKTSFNVEVHGDQVSYFNRIFGIPGQPDNAIKQRDGNSALIGIFSYFYAFLFCLLLQVIFLRKYHEGEVGVKSAAIIFFICWLTMAADTALKFKTYGLGTSIGELSHDYVGLVVIILLSLVAWPFFSIMGFSAWSIGESLGRERFAKKFAAVDALLSKQFSTLNAASSMLNGYLAGFFGLGLIALFSFIVLNPLGGQVSGINFNKLSTPLPFLLPLLSAIPTALLSEMVFRLFCNLILGRYLKKRYQILIVSSLLWTLFAMGFWKIGFSFYPIIAWLGLLFVMGLYLGFLFWKFDLLTSIVANFTIVALIQTLPMLTSSAPETLWQGILSLLLIFLPVVYIVQGFIVKKNFSFKADLIPDHVKRITQRARMSKELEIARRVQMSLLPSRCPEFEGFEIEGVCIPANEVGGDYYDFIPIDQQRMGIVIGDVSGKGVPAAIYMTLTKGIIQSHVENRFSPEQVLTRVNRSLFTMMDQKSFVTLFFGVLDSREKTLTYSRAGHNPLYHFRGSDDTMTTIKPKGIALGIEKGKIFDNIITEGVVPLQKGDLVVFYTDGFTEAMNNQLVEYGEERLADIIRRNKIKPVQQIIETVIFDVQQFVKGYPQHDDMTMVIVKVY